MNNAIPVTSEVLKNSNKWTFSFNIFVVVDFPDTLSFEGKTYWKTDKVGNSIKTGVPSVQYEHYDYRIWLTADNNITKD